MKEKKNFLVTIRAEFEYPCEAFDEVEAEMLGRHVAAGELGNTPLLGAATWFFSADQVSEDEWA
ncbi:MAG: hypothetical protein ACRD2L_04730, partial [Terriglobia bacterium]